MLQAQKSFGQNENEAICKIFSDAKFQSQTSSASSYAKKLEKQAKHQQKSKRKRETEPTSVASMPEEKSAATESQPKQNTQVNSSTEFLQTVYKNLDEPEVSDGLKQDKRESREDKKRRLKKLKKEYAEY